MDHKDRSKWQKFTFNVDKHASMAVPLNRYKIFPGQFDDLLKEKIDVRDDFN